MTPALHPYRVHCAGLQYITLARSACEATLIPPGTDASDVETLADKRLLPTIRVKAPCCQSAERAAKHVTGHPVLRAERVEEVAA